MYTIRLSNKCFHEVSAYSKVMQKLDVRYHGENHDQGLNISMGPLVYKPDRDWEPTIISTWHSKGRQLRITRFGHPSRYSCKTVSGISSFTDCMTWLEPGSSPDQWVLYPQCYRWSLKGFACRAVLNSAAFNFCAYLFHWFLFEISIISDEV